MKRLGRSDIRRQEGVVQEIERNDFRGQKEGVAQ